MKHLKHSILILTALWVCLAPADAGAEFRALLVGIDYRNADPAIRPLSGAVNDVNDMAAVMTGPLGIPGSCIQKLTEEKATRDAILETFRAWLIEGTRPGDTVFFHYSGHGLQVPDPFGNQANDPLKQDAPRSQGLAEAFAPFDTRIDRKSKKIGNIILDTELNQLLQKLAGRDVTLLLDCCHSGGVTRDIKVTQTVTRYLELPWDPSETRVDTSGMGLNPTDKGIVRFRPEKTWRPDYVFLAAAQYFQSAYEYPVHAGRNGAFTLPILNFLRANAGKQFTNGQILNYAGTFIREKAGIPEAYQKPVFYGPAKASERPFALLAVTATQPDQPSPPPPSSEPKNTCVRLTGADSRVRDDLETAIKTSGFARICQEHADVTINVSAARVDMLHASGKKIASFPNRDATVAQAMKALEGVCIVRELAALDNPAAPFATELWLDQPGKTEFSVTDKVTLYYRVNRLPGNQSAYLTLINAAPDGTVSILYPQKADYYAGPGEKRFLNAPVEPGEIGSIPKPRQALSDGQNVAVDLRIRLSAGEEYFKAIITSAPMDWENMGMGNFRSSFKGQGARTFAAKMAKSIKRMKFWGTGSLRAEVKK